MADLAGITDIKAVGERARTAMTFPIGAASPLWFAYGAAASAGVAWWWMTHWTKAVNVEALASAAAEAMAAPAAAVERLAVYGHAAELEAAEIAADVIETVTEAVETLSEAPALIAEPALAELEKVAESAAEPMPADDLTQLVGIGPKLAQALAERGVTRFAQIATWKTADLVAVDEALSLKGRAVRDAWVAQAKRLAASPSAE